MIDLSQLVGKPFGGFFEVKDSKSGKIEEIKDVHTLTCQFTEDMDFGDDNDNQEEIKETVIDPNARDNRDYVDDNKS